MSAVVMKPHALAVCLHISRVIVSAYCRASFVAPLFMKSIFSTMVDTSGMGVGACATEDCRKGSRTFQEEQPGCLLEASRTCRLDRIESTSMI